MAVLRGGPFELTVIAETGGRFGRFAPYVPAVRDDGAVVFQAELAGIAAPAGSVVCVALSSQRAEDDFEFVRVPGMSVVSHPAVAGDRCCFYARNGSGGRVVVLARPGGYRIIAADAGPLGPTMNPDGWCAFRMHTGEGEAVCVGNHEGYEPLAVTGHAIEIGGRRTAIRGFNGLPVINAAGSVAFCVDLSDGVRAVMLREQAGARVLVHTGERFTSLGLFPVLDDTDGVVFAASEREGSDGRERSGIFIADRGGDECVVNSAPDGRFESFRGAIIDGHGRVVYFATPRDGQLGIYHGPNPATDRVLGVGDELLGSTVTDFALNAVSINRDGVIAVRVGFDGERGAVLRGVRL